MQQKYGEISTAPYLEVTNTGAVVSIHFQFAPYTLRHELGRRRGGRATARDRYACPIRAGLQVVNQAHAHNHTARSQSTYGLSEGDLNHGQLILTRCSSCARCGLVEPQDSDRRAVPVRQRRPWRRWHQRCERQECGKYRSIAGATGEASTGDAMLQCYVSCSRRANSAFAAALRNRSTCKCFGIRCRSESATGCACLQLRLANCGRKPS